MKKRIPYLLLAVCLLAISAHAQAPITIHGGLQDGCGSADKPCLLDLPKHSQTKKITVQFSNLRGDFDGLGTIIVPSRIEAFLAVPQPAPQSTPSPCVPAGSHCTTLTWTESSSGAITFNVFRGTTAGGEGATPINPTPLSVLTYQDPVTLTSSSQTFFYKVQAIQVTGGITQTATSSEVSATFPAILVAPAATAAVQ